MKLVIAQMKHETNTFSPVPTPLARFARGQESPPEGEEALAACVGTGSAIGAFIELAQKAGANIDVPIAASAWPSGPVHDDAFEYMADRICASVAAGCDAVLLDLHGAMVTQSLDDGEGELLNRLRRIDPKVPIGIALDMHTNLYPALVEQATVLAGYQTYPHVDVYETGLRAAAPIFSMLEGKTRPTMVWGNRPMLPHVMRQSSLDEPNRSLQQRAIEMERTGALTASLFVGFPHADIVNAGLSSVIVTDGNRELASRYCNELLDSAFDQRERFVYEVEPLSASMTRAQALTGGPVVLLDHYDNAASGGTMDTTAVLEAMLEAGLSNAAAFAIYDPDVVSQMQQAGLGANVNLSLGGKLDMPSLGLTGKPCKVSGTVKRITDGQYRNRGPMSKGVLMDMGPTAVLDTGNIEIIIISKQQEPNDLECFYSVGVDPMSKQYVMIKSRVHWRAGMGEMAKHTVECAGVGVCTSDYNTLDFRKVRRPIFPLDQI